jgi:hypothetical protein
MLCDLVGPHGRAVLLGRKTERLIQEDAGRYNLRNTGNIVYWLFPNVVLSMPMSGHAELWQTYPDPDTPGRCTVTLRFYVPGAQAGEDRSAFWQRMIDHTVRIVMEEGLPPAGADLPGARRVTRSVPLPARGRAASRSMHF